MEKEKILSLIKIFLIILTVVFLILGLSNILGSKKALGTESCRAQINDFDCYRDYYLDYVDEEGVAKGFELLKKEYKTNQYIVSQCHQMTHVIGHAGVALYPEVSEAFKHGDPFCWSGYYHGVMEEIVEKIGVAKVSKELDNVCSKIPGKESYSFDYFNCVHGLGHGVMAMNNNDLFKSLVSCDILGGSWEKQSCYGGVFMENVMIDYRGEETKYLKKDDLLYPCNAVGEAYKGACYLMQTSYALKATGYNFPKVFGLCRSADKGYEATCFQSLGRDASGSTVSNAEKTWAKCDLGKDYFEKTNCMIGAVKDFISYFHSDKEARVLCSTVSEDLRKACLDTASSYYKSF